MGADVRPLLACALLLAALLAPCAGCTPVPDSGSGASQPVEKRVSESGFGQLGSMPKTGSARVIALRVTFPEYDGLDGAGFAEGDDLDALASLVEGGVSADGFPYDNLADYYSRSSYGRLSVSGDVFDYRSPNSRDYCASHKEELVLDALRSLAERGVALSDYDGDSDGLIDCIYIHPAGPLPRWGEGWWSTTEFYAGEQTVDGVGFGSYITLHRPSDEPGAARNMLHETGHALGLPDLYSEHGADNTAADGSLVGSKTFDMMDTSTADIDAYFKWCLGWLDDSQVEIVAPGTEAEVELVASGAPPREGLRLLVVGDGGMFGRMYAVQYDTFSGNDSVYVGDERSQSPLPAGFRVLRIDSIQEDGRTVKDNSAEVPGEKLLEALDVDAQQEHAVYHGMPYALDAPYNCMLLAGQSASVPGADAGFDGELSVEALSCSGDVGRVRIRAR